jgi:hypothetical protein
MKLMDKYLDDVEHFVINFESTDGFSLVLDELKKMNASGSANYAMEDCDMTNATEPPACWERVLPIH